MKHYKLDLTEKEVDIFIDIFVNGITDGLTLDPNSASVIRKVTMLGLEHEKGAVFIPPKDDACA